MPIPETAVIPVAMSIPDLDWDGVHPSNSALPYQDRLLLAMDKRMKVLLSIGRAAYKSAQAEGDTGTCGQAFVTFKVREETKAVLTWLYDNFDASHEIVYDPWRMQCEFDALALLEEGDVPAQSIAVQAAGCRALASALMSIGVPCHICHVKTRVN